MQVTAWCTSRSLIGSAVASVCFPASLEAIVCHSWLHFLVMLILLDLLISLVAFPLSCLFTKIRKPRSVEVRAETPRQLAVRSIALAKSR